MELDCALYDNVFFDGIDTNDDYFPISLYYKHNNIKNGFSVTKYGTYYNHQNTKCIIFPKGKTTWEGFQRPFKDGEVVVYDNPYREHLQIFIFKDKKENSTLSTCYLMLDDDGLVLEEGAWYVTRIATEEEKEKLFKAIKDNGYKWNSETKTLDKLITPKKFDITTLKPFDKVLIRDFDKNMWCASIFSHTWKNLYYCVGIWHNQCIPYEGNEHLLGTTKDCDDFYKNW